MQTWMSKILITWYVHIEKINWEILTWLKSSQLCGKGSYFISLKQFMYFMYLLKT